MMSSSAWEVVPEVVAHGVWTLLVVAPVLVPAWSRTELETRPENAFTATAFATTAAENVTVMESLVVSAVVTGAEKTTVRTPAVPDPFVTSASLVYVFLAVGVSAHETVVVTGAGSIARVTMIVLPTAMPEGTGTLIGG